MKDPFWGNFGGFSVFKKSFINTYTPGRQNREVDTAERIKKNELIVREWLKVERKIRTGPSSWEGWWRASPLPLSLPFVVTHTPAPATDTSDALGHSFELP
jgi:hypothetical protein